MSYISSPTICVIRRHVTESAEACLALNIIALAISDAKGAGFRRKKRSPNEVTMSINQIQEARYWISDQDGSFALAQFSENEFDRLKALIGVKINEIDLQVKNFKGLYFKQEDIDLLKNKLNSLGTEEAKTLSSKLLNTKGFKYWCEILGLDYEWVSKLALTEIEEHACKKIKK